MIDVTQNLNAIRNLVFADQPETGRLLYETLAAMQTQLQTIQQQGNQNGARVPLPPPQPNGVTVLAQNGHFQIAIQDANEFYRGINYHVEHADNPAFTDSHTIHLGPTRNHDLYLGNVTRYFRAYSSYAGTAVSKPVYHGSREQPAAVIGGGSDTGPSFLPSMGSGTGQPGEGLSGPGPVQFRSTTGRPPIRK